MTTKNNIPAGYKDSAVGVIPQEWEVRTFQELGSMLGTNTLSRDKMNECSGCAQNIHYGDVLVKYGEVLDCTSMNIPWVNSDCRNANLGTNLQNGDIVISDTAEDYTVGKATEVQGVGTKIVLSGLHTIAFRPNVGMFASNFLGYYFNSTIYRSQLYPLIQGIKVCSISKKAISNTKLAVPPLAEQRKIAEILGAWDEAIEKQSRLIEKLELRKRALMQRLLTGRTRLSGFTTPWQKVKLGEIGNFDKGAGVPKEKIVSEGCKAITYGEIYTKYDYVIKDFASYIDSDTAQTSKQISTGAILFAGSGETLEDIGKCVAFIDNDKAYAGGDIIIFNPSIEVDSLVLSYILNSPVAIAQKRRYGQGHSVVHIYQKDLARIEFELPSLPEQKAIAEVLTTAGKEIATHRKKLDALRLQKRGLMQQLLTGKTRIKI